MAAWLAVLVAAWIGLSAAGAEALSREAADRLAGDLRAHGFSGVLSAQAGDRKLFRFASRAEISDDAVFWVGSVSKQFAAVGALRLVDRGKLALDAPVASRIGLDFGPFGACTLAQVLHHTCGLPTGNECSFEGLDDSAVQERFGRCLATAKPRSRPGAEFAYSNAGYDLVGVLISRAAGTGFGEVLEREFFAPLGLRHTGLRLQERRLRLVQGEAFWGAGWLPTWPWLLLDPAGPGRAGASGNLFSSVADLHAWNRALHGGRLLSPAAYKRLVTPDREDYGLGIAIERERDGSRWFWHNGSLAPMGWSALVAYLPTRSISVVGLANRSRHTSLVQPAAKRLVETALGSRQAAPPLAPPAATDRAVELTFFVFPILLVGSTLWLAWTLVRGPREDSLGWCGTLLVSGALYLYAVSLIDFYGRAAWLSPPLLAVVAAGLVWHRRRFDGAIWQGWGNRQVRGALFGNLAAAALLAVIAPPPARVWLAFFVACEGLALYLLVRLRDRWGGRSEH